MGRAGFGAGGGQIYLANLRCNGTEENLLECPSIGPGAFCFHSEDAGVICKGRPPFVGGASHSPRKQGSVAAHQIWEGVWHLIGYGRGVAAHWIWEGVWQLIGYGRGCGSSSDMGGSNTTDYGRLKEVS